MKRRLKRLARTLGVRGGKQPSERRLGDQARERGDWVAAAEHYRRHVDRNRTDFDIWVQLGHALKEIGRYEDAGRTYAQASELRPRDADLLLMRGHLAKTMGDTATALNLYTMSFNVDGNPFAGAEVNNPSHASQSPTSDQATATASSAVEGIVDGVLIGWALGHPDDDAPAEIEIVSNGEVISHSVANLFRSDLVDRAPSSRIGFAVDLVELIDLSQASLLNIRLRDSGEDLPGSPIAAGLPDSIARWSARHDDLTPKDIEKLRARMTAETLGAKVTFILPWDQTSEDRGYETLTSLHAQWCPHWELVCAVDDALVPEGALSAAMRDPRVRILRAKGAAAHRRALEAANDAEGDLVAVIAPGLVLEPETVFRLLDAGQSGDIVYGDEARFGLTPASVHRIVTRPGYSPHVAPTFDFGPLVAVRRDLLQSISAQPGARWEDAVRAASERADGVAHIPTVLCRAPDHPMRMNSATNVERTIDVAAAPDHQERPDDHHPQPSRTLIVLRAPARTDILRDAVEAILMTTARQEADLFLLDDEEGDMVRKRYVAGLEKQGIHVGAPDAQSDLDDVLMAAAERQRAYYDYIAFIGKAVQPASSGWLEALREVLEPADVGIVGGTIVDPWGEKASAGFVLAPNGNLIPARIESPSGPGRSPEQGVSARSAVSSSFMLMRTEVFVRLGGFDAALEGHERDADLCLRAARAGLDVLSANAVIARRLADHPHHASEAHPSPTFLRRWRRHLAEGDFNAGVQSWNSLDPSAPSNWRAPVRIAQAGARRIIAEARLTPNPVGRLQEEARS